ncbi:MAG: Uma2 family endonuclease [Pseudonocardia sp.]
MRAVMLDVPQSMLDERRALGLDGRDEMWDGVLHMPPPPGGPHQRLSTRFNFLLTPVVERHGLVSHMETGLFRRDDDYRVPDQLYCRPEHCSERGAEGAEVVVEVRSDGDDTYRKFEFYAELGVREVLVLHQRPRGVELFRLVDGRYVAVSPAEDGTVLSQVLGLRLGATGEQLHLTWGGGSANV